MERYAEIIEEMEKLPFTEICAKSKKFYAEMQKPDITYYAKKTVVTMRFGLQKHFLKKASIYIVNSEVFKAMLVKLKREGALRVKHSNLLNKMYESETLSLNSVVGRLNRIFFKCFLFL
jgi:hypothetical protein